MTSVYTAWYYILKIKYYPEGNHMNEMFFCPNCMAKISPTDIICPVCGRDVSAKNEPHQLPVNSILYGRYLVGKVLGEGGFGITYMGYDLRLDGKVAIKEYYPNGLANRSMSLTVIPTTGVKGNSFRLGKDRFLKEAKTLSEFVEDCYIVTLRDYFEENGTSYIVMEYLEGQDLSHYAKEHGRFELDEALDLLEPAMLALDEVHKKGLIHRDISPSNIMVLNDGRVKVLDFGSARAQSIGGELSLSIMLKPGYAPVEQYSLHGEQGSWTDVYAMSATIYRLITGKTPPTSTDRILGDTLEPPSKLGVKITPAQEKALMRGLALKSTDRTQTMAELAKSLRAEHKVFAAKPDTSVKEPQSVRVSVKKKMPTFSKKRLLIIGAALLAVLVICITVPTAKRGKSEKAQTSRSESVVSETKAVYSIRYNAATFADALVQLGTISTERQKTEADGSVDGNAALDVTISLGKDDEYELLRPDAEQIIATVPDSRGRKFVYFFDGWRVGSSDDVLPADKILTSENILKYASNGKVTLNAVWVAKDINDRIMSVNFFINLDGEVADNRSDGLVIHSNGNFSDSMYTAGILGTGNIPVSDGINYLLLAPPNEKADAHNTNATMRAMTGTAYEGVTLTSFPDDEDVLKSIRDGGYSVVVNGAAVPADKLTAQNYTVVWYVLKYQEASGWHADGIITAK